MPLIYRPSHPPKVPLNALALRSNAARTNVIHMIRLNRLPRPQKWQKKTYFIKVT
ncbi:hypothetical protein PISMIDRAFT_682703 [Pisolithus microcarpus 441]|uniref:Uncharacterized protein n=1 Tax=Pisolithus microcarpus 441 TaxID=765257 RepID=A0A0C9Z0Z7_9AGAM|nr:hypothetical protein PISMIDRAFT_682703 [Pisolithus microcarpus 441]